MFGPPAGDFLSKPKKNLYTRTRILFIHIIFIVKRMVIEIRLVNLIDFFHLPESQRLARNWFEKAEISGGN